MNILELLNDAWAIKPSHLEQIQRLYFERKERRLSAAELRDVELAIGRPLNNNDDKPYQVIDGVAVIPVLGSIAKRGSMFTNVSGLTSYEAIQRNLRQAQSDPQVTAALLNFDSPGGVANGTPTCAAAIERFGKVKPIAAWTDGMMTSAAQWLGAATGDIRIANDTTELGSIGVIARHVDVSRMEEIEGVKTTVLTAGRYKGVGHPYAPLSSEHQGVMQERLDYLYSAFANAMAGYRNVSIDEVLKTMADGRIFTGKQAIDIGLADGMMDFDDMLGHLRDRAKTMKQTSATSRFSAENTQKEVGMKKEDLQRDHASLFAEILEEGRQQGVTEGITQGALAELNRIQGVLTLPGAAAQAHKELLNKLAFDGQTTAEGASHQVLLAEEALREAAANDMAAGAAKPAPAAAAEGGEVEAQATAEQKSMSEKMIAMANAGR